jgi:FHS family L-fucose permease-like MFS transporter
MENNANTLSEKNVANNSSSIPVVPAQYRIYFFLLVSCFALWGLLNNMTDNLVPSFAIIVVIF